MGFISLKLFHRRRKTRSSVSTNDVEASKEEVIRQISAKLQEENDMLARTMLYDRNNYLSPWSIGEYICLKDCLAIIRTTTTMKCKRMRMDLICSHFKI